MMTKRLLTALTLAGLLAMAIGAEAQGSLSNQVLRLLTRNNTWSGTNTYDHTVGVTLGAGTAPTLTANTLYNIAGTLYWNGSALPAGAGGGTVTSVAMTVPAALLSISGSPITTSGTLAVTLGTRSANTIFAGPTTGAAATPTFRALVAADIPDISATYATASNTMAFTNKSGNISQWTNDSGYITTLGTGSTGITTLGTITTGTWNATVVAGQYGGTGVANTGKTITLGGNLTTSGAFNTTLTVTAGTSVTLPTSGTLVNSAVTTLSSLVSIGTVTTGTWNGTAIGVAYGGTNIASYTTGDIIYASGATTLSKLADVATGNVLISGGVSTAPSWGKVSLTAAVSGTLPAANGGLGITTTTDDAIPVGSGAAWVSTVLPSGVLSYSAAGNSFSVPTTFILGTGAPTPSANNILLRSTVNAMLEVMEGNAADVADIRLRNVAIGGASDTTFASTYNTYVNLLNTYTGADPARGMIGLESVTTLTPSANMTQAVWQGYDSITTADTHNFSGDIIGRYIKMNMAGSGTTTLLTGLKIDSTQALSGTTTTNIGADINAFGGGTSTITNNIGARIKTPTKGTTLTNNYGLYIQDQTLAGTTLNYAIYYPGTSATLAWTADATVFMTERAADPSAPAANSVVIYTKDNGAGKTEVCALFSSGAAQCFAVQP